jgi:N-acetylglucosamine kinase-like BadF-type ATPase
MAEHEDVRKTTGKILGINLDLGIAELNITLSLSGIRTLTDTLSQALEQSEGALSENVDKVVGAIRELGVQDLKRWVQQGGEEEKSVYNQFVSKLQQAARRGQDEARNLLQSLGENVSAAGEKIKGAASEEPGTRH